MKTTIIAATSAAILLAATSAVFAQQGTTLAGPAQGSKANAAPSESRANSGLMTRGGAMTGRSDSAAPGAPSGTGGTGFGATTTR